MIVSPSWCPLGRAPWITRRGSMPPVGSTWLRRMTTSSLAAAIVLAVAVRFSGVPAPTEPLPTSSLTIAQGDSGGTVAAPEDFRTTAGPVDIVPPDVMRRLAQPAWNRHRTEVGRIGIINGDHFYLMNRDCNEVAAVPVRGEL